MPLPPISKILKDAEAIPERKKRIAFLKTHNPNGVLKQILKNIYDPSIKFDLPEGAPPYKVNEDWDNATLMYQESRRFYLFREGGNPNLHPLKREMIFIEILEALPPEEAELLIAMKDKKMPYKGITKAIVKEAFPGLLK